MSKGGVVEHLLWLGGSREKRLTDQG